jgi:hypothetical protein
MKDEDFAQAQHRRVQTEARIAIFKNEFLGCPMRSLRLWEPGLASGVGRAHAQFMGAGGETARAAKDPGAKA